MVVYTGKPGKSGMDPLLELDQDLLLCVLAVTRLGGLVAPPLPPRRTAPPTRPETLALRSLRDTLPRGKVSLDDARRELALFTGDLFRAAVAGAADDADGADNDDDVFVQHVAAKARGETEAIRTMFPLFYGDPMPDIAGSLTAVVEGTGTVERGVAAMERRATLLQAQGLDRTTIAAYVRMMRPYLRGGRWGPGSRRLCEAMDA